MVRSMPDIIAKERKTNLFSKEQEEEKKEAKQGKIRTEVSVAFSLGSSSSRISAGKRRMNLPRAIKPNAYEASLTSFVMPGDKGSALNARKLAWSVVSP